MALRSMGNTDPLEPGRIPGQNPNTPERLQGEMEIGADRPGNHKAFLLALIGIPAALAVAVFLIYATMSADPGTRPAGTSVQDEQPKR